MAPTKRESQLRLHQKIAGGLEYYASYGSLDGFALLRDQQQQFFPAIDIDVASEWGFNFGVGIGATLPTITSS
jgi:hypothetical protein